MQAGQTKTSPESVARANRITNTLRNRGRTLEQPSDFGLEPILAVHDKAYISFLQSAYQRWTKVFGSEKKLMPNVHPHMPYDSKPESIVGQLGWFTADMACEITEGTWRAAYSSAQAAVNAAQQTLADGKTHYALCRPPGHHAFSNKAMGFCYLNNSAIAAQVLRSKFSRVAIIDVDVHHGNGTQEIFYQRSDVFTLSTHSHPKKFYPFFSGYPTEIGENEGEGYNLNVTYEFGCDEGPFLEAIKIGLEAITYYGPEAVVIALGLDASEQDPHGEHHVKQAAFKKMGVLLKKLEVPTVIVQEGGYNSDILGDLVADVLDALDA
ncbi:MAG: histone deacetylase family protein [Colwellia sp.]|nr:histone deacetylase family protein [Colwellia sp.]